MSSLDVAAIQQQVAAQREAIITFLRELVAIPDRLRLTLAFRAAIIWMRHMWEGE